MYISISLKSFQETLIVLNLDNNTILYNNNLSHQSANIYLDRIKSILKSWETFYSNSSIIDGSSYKVEIYNGVNKVIYRGINKFPENYNNFLELVEEIKQNA